MNTLKSSEDPALYRRAKRYVEEGDKTFEPVLEWFQNGKKHNNAEKFPDQHKLATLLKERYYAFSLGQLVRAFGEYETFYYRLRSGQYRYVPAHKCKEILKQI